MALSTSCKALFLDTVSVKLQGVVPWVATMRAEAETVTRQCEMGTLYVKFKLIDLVRYTREVKLKLF